MKAFGRASLVLLCTICLHVVNSIAQTPLRQSSGDGILVSRAESNSTIEPISASVSQYWEGNDGIWSSFNVQIGQKAQNVRVLPSTASTSTWVVLNEGCPSDAPSKCDDNRGGIFNPNNSLTWVPNSIFQLGLEQNLDYNVFGEFGFDTVTLGWQGSGGPTVEHSIVAGIADTSFSWLGVLGLNPRPTNFSTFPNSPQVSFLQALKNQKNIPSLSWAYTAGASYRLDKIFGSLTLGGYDTSRFSIPTDKSSGLTFPFYTDISRDLLVGISSIETTNTTSSLLSSKLTTESFFAFVDSTVPHFWLPQSVCTAFESAFGLAWNSTTEQYILNSTQHDRLSKLNPSISFTLSPVLPPKSYDQSIVITLPYTAFDLNISWPHSDSSVYYFPLKRATNDTQYTLGRAFLQEAYIIADYERSNFSVWPCEWNSKTNTPNIITIKSLDNINSTSPTHESIKNSKNGLSTGAIAGLAVGIFVIVIGIIVGTFLFVRRRRHGPRKSFELASWTQTDPPSHHYVKAEYPPELQGDSHYETARAHKVGIFEAPQGDQIQEVAGDTVGRNDKGVDGSFPFRTKVHELDGGEVRHEMPSVLENEHTGKSQAFYRRLLP